MTFSVVIPLFNKRSSIERAIRSVLAQTVKDFELLVVDDGSTDGSGKIAESIEDSRIRVIRQLNAGEAAARNRGIAEAKAAPIAFLDADDRWAPDFLAEIERMAERQPDAALYATGIAVQHPDGRIEQPDARAIARFVDAEGRLDLYGALAKRQFPVSSSSVCVPARRFEQAGVFDTKLPLATDIDMWVRLCALGPAIYSPEVRATYHKDAENRSNARPDFWEKRVAFAISLGEKIARLPLSARDGRKLRLFRSRVLIEAQGQRDASDEALRMVDEQFGTMAVRHRVRSVLRQYRKRFGRA